jgi:transposase
MLKKSEELWDFEFAKKLDSEPQKHQKMLPVEQTEYAEELPQTARFTASKRQGSKVGDSRMEVVYERCAGLDVHKKSVVVCRVMLNGDGNWQREVRTFGTMTQDLLQLRDWLSAGQIRQIAMESTGVYWQPIFNILESEFEVLVVNAKHIKFVPGHKTDIKDAEWIADLLQHGLLKASFIPKSPQRELRELIRYRTHLVDERSREVNRVQRVLEMGNLKLSSVVTDIMGQSSRAILEQIIAGKDDPAALAQLAKGKLRPKIAELERALMGQITETQRLLLRLHLEHIDDVNTKVQELEIAIETALSPFDENELMARLDTIPGVSRLTAQVIVAELGTDMTRFPTAAHAASWAGVAPGKNESAGRNRSAKTPHANSYLKRALVEAAHAAGRSKDNYLSAQYRRLAARRGKKRAAIAVAHSILVIAYHLIQRGTSYVELGANYYDQRQTNAVQQQLVKRLERLGFQVTLETIPNAA